MIKKLNIGIVGLGRIARYGHAPEITKHLDKFKLAACADIDQERISSLKRKTNFFYRSKFLTNNNFNAVQYQT